MRFRFLIISILIFLVSACQQPEIPVVERPCSCVTIENYYTYDFIKMLKSRINFLRDINYLYYLEFGHTKYQISFSTTGPVWDVAMLGRNKVLIQYMDTMATAYYEQWGSSPVISFLPYNPAYTGLYDRDSISVYGIRNDSVFVYYPDSNREELFTVLPFNTRHIIVSPDGRYVGSPDGRIFDVVGNRLVGDFRSLGWDFDFVDDSTVIFGDSVEGFSVKWLRVTNGEIVKAIPVTYQWASKPVQIYGYLYFVSGDRTLRTYLNYDYGVSGKLIGCDLE